MSTREELTTLATELIQEGGIDSVSFRTLADRVGVKSASVHYHFPAKGDLTQAVVAQYAEHFAAELELIERQHDTLRAKLERLVGVFESVLAQKRLCLCGSLASNVTSLDDATEKLLQRYFRETEAWIERQAQQHADQLRADLDPGTLSRLLLASLEGANLVDRVTGNGDHLDAVRQLLRLVTN